MYTMQFPHTHEITNYIAETISKNKQIRQYNLKSNEHQKEWNP